MNIDYNEQILCSVLNNCGVHITRTQQGWRFSSRRKLFIDFTIFSEIKHWDQQQGLYQAQGIIAYFPGTAVRIQVVSGSILLVYPSGHIRWMTEQGFKYYSTLSHGRSPTFCQGDLVIFQLMDKENPIQFNEIEKMLPQNLETLWYCPPLAYQEFVDSWRESKQINLGGNARHRACGLLEYLMPIKKDHRTVLIRTLDRIFLTHDPIDDIHPTIILPPGQRYLISKLPGFSDPITEMNKYEEVMP